VFPTADADLNCELSPPPRRQVPTDKTSLKKSAGPHEEVTDPTERVHYPLVFARLQRERLGTAPADRLLTLDAAYAKAVTAKLRRTNEARS
jgi:hypothetical protein